MPLITSTTSLNKLKFGSGNAGDRFDNGFSNQPYITTDIPGVNVDNSNPTPITELDSNGNPIYGDVTPGSLDILFRGGLNAIKDSITDVSRLTKMFFDTKSPNGLIFIGNQNLLSRTSVMTEASYGWGYGRNKEPNFITGKGGGALPGGIYLPSSTLAQAAVNFTGTHLNLMGIDPTSPNGITGGQAGGISGLFSSPDDVNVAGAGLRSYSMVMDEKLQNDTEEGAELSNRLVRIFEDKQAIKPENIDTNVIKYNGGPGSILGIGKTRIRFAGSNGAGNTRTGLNNALAVDNPSYFFNSGDNKDFTYSQKYNYTTLPDGVTLAYGITEVNNGIAVGDLSGKLGLSKKIPNFNPSEARTIFDINMLSATYTLGSSFEDLSDTQGIGARGIYTANVTNDLLFNTRQIFEASNNSLGSEGITIPGAGKIGKAFNNILISASLIESGSLTTSNITSISPDYNSKNLNLRTNFGDPGSIGPKSKGINTTHRLNYGIDATEMLAVDKINAQLMYTNSGVAQQTQFAKNDLVKFRIASINNDDPATSVFMHFRAFIDGFSDKYSSTWDSVKYAGRGENLYHYNGFDRSIDLSFTCYAQSKAELIPMYRKLNYLASTLAPDYTAAGFMRGNIVRLTLGGYLYEQPGFISGMTFEAPQESSWEIAINEEGSSDSSVKELPFMIKVTGMSFTPIHEFLPSKIRSDSANGMTPDGVMIDERYIALDNGFTENYTNAQGTYSAQLSTNTDAGNILADVNIETT